MIRIESSVLVRDSGILPQPRSGPASAHSSPAWAPRMKHLLIYSSEGCFTLQIQRFPRYKINGVVCKLKELEHMSVQKEVTENTVLTVDEYRLVLAGFNPMWVDNGEWARAMKLNEQITNAKKNTEVKK